MTITTTDMDIEARGGQGYRRVLGEIRDNIDTVHVGAKLREHSSLIPGSSADLQDFLARLQVKQAEHVCDDVRLRNSLPVPDITRTICVVVRTSIRFRYELVSPDLAHCVKHGRIRESMGLDLSDHLIHSVLVVGHIEYLLVQHRVADVSSVFDPAE